MKRSRKQPDKKGKKKVAAKTPEAASGEYSNDGLSKRRLRLFRLLALSLPFVVLLLAEIAFRVIPGLNVDRDPYINISPVSIFSRASDPATGELYYNITHPAVLNAKDVHIPVKKPANTIRIFCLGSSACANWPHPAAETWSANCSRRCRRPIPAPRGSNRLVHRAGQPARLAPDGFAQRPRMFPASHAPLLACGVRFIFTASGV